MINIPSTAQDLSNDYTALGTWIGLGSVDGGNPDGQPVEIPIGASGYARAQANWMPQGDGVNVAAPVTLSAPEGHYSFVLLCAQSDPSQPGDKLIDFCNIDATLNGDGEIVVTPQYTQT